MAKGKAKHKPDPNQYHLPGVDPDAQEKFDFAKPPVPSAAKKRASDVGPPNLGKAVKLSVPDFSRSDRPKTCLEVDFPIPQINELSSLEGNAGKPIYQMSKWWARRRSSVFRAMLIAAAVEAPSMKDDKGNVLFDENGVPVPDREKVAGLIWDHYYANHQKAGNFSHLKVLDCFMGGGTTLVEGSRLGFQVAGVDLNPVAWFVVKNELACTDPREVAKFFNEIEAEVKPAIQPFYVTECPRGHVGQWFKIAPSSLSPALCGGEGRGEGLEGSKNEPMPADFDPIALSPEERKQYRYEGPEVIYTFWAKHGQCTKPGCGHRTPVFRTPVIAEKKLGVKFIELTCKSPSCKTRFHAELGDARMAPAAERVILDNVEPFTALSQPFAQRLLDYSKGIKADKMCRAAELFEMVDDEPGLCCPKCGQYAGQYLRDVLQAHKRAVRATEIDKKHLRIQPARNAVKPVYSYLLIDPEWIKGSPGFVGNEELGGHPDASVQATERWYQERLKNLNLIEVRGRIKLDEDTSALAADAEPIDEEPEDEEEVVSEEGAAEEVDADRKQFGLPRFITLASGRKVDTKRGVIPKKSHFTCGKCGLTQHLNEATEASKHAATIASYSLQKYCPTCHSESRVYNGRSFQTLKDNDLSSLAGAEAEWAKRCENDLRDYWPREELPHTYMTHHANFALPRQGYTHWSKMFSARQLLVHAQLLRFASEKCEVSGEVRHQALGAVQQYLRNQNLFVFWNIQADKIEPFFSNSNYAPKNLPVENAVFADLGRGNWRSTANGVIDGLAWNWSPWEVALPSYRAVSGEPRISLEDRVLPGADIRCQSSSELDCFEDGRFDLVITDPPFGDNIFYSDLANFFYAWLRLPLLKEFPNVFKAEKTPNAQEALAPRLLPDAEANEYYKLRLTACWAEAGLKLKTGGIMAFTFHHSEDSQWAVVLESLFDAGFLLEQTFPIASDEQKGAGGQFGAKGTEHDIIHVCRKRLEEPTPVSWPKMRQWVKAELERLKPLLAAYKTRELSNADIRLILRGKALEFYSKHYGQLYTISGDGHRETMTLQTALAGINQLLDEGGDDAEMLPPSNLHPHVYSFLRLFGTRKVMTTENVKKSLYSTTVVVKDLEDRGWVYQDGKNVKAHSIADRFEYCRSRPRKEMKTELDQAQFLVGGAITGDVNLEEELTKDTWMVSPYVVAVLDWYGKFSPEAKIAEAAKLAAETLRRTKEKLRTKAEFVDRQTRLFDMEGEEW
jgi:adenine-specific DNA methylase